MKIYALITILALSSCAPQHVDTAEIKTISEQEYADYNCKQISAEMRRVSSKLEDIRIPKEQASADTLGQVLGTALQVYGMTQGYRPASTAKKDTGEQILEVRYETLERLSIDKECF